MENCLLTKLPTKDFCDFGTFCQYGIEYEGAKFQITLGLEFLNFSKTHIFNEKAYLLAGAILNGQLIDLEVSGCKIFQIGSDWKEKIVKITYPKTPKDKMDNLLKTLYLFQNFDGDEVDVSDLVRKPAFWYKHFFKNEFECYYYFRILKSQNLINATIQNFTNIPM